MSETAAAMRLNKLVEFQKNTGTTPDSRGHPEKIWTTQYREFCSILPLTGNELVVQRQVHPLVSHKITTRWQSSVTPLPTWRIKFGNRIFHIESILNVEERNEFWEIMAVEKIDT